MSQSIAEYGWYLVAIALMLGVVAGYLGATAFEDILEWRAWREYFGSPEWKQRCGIEDFFNRGRDADGNDLVVAEAMLSEHKEYCSFKPGFWD